MIIYLSPLHDFNASPLDMERDGGDLIINGVSHNIAALDALEPDEYDMVNYPYPIINVQGEAVTVRLEYSDVNAPEAVRFPVPITDPPDGPINLPGEPTDD